MPPPPIPKPPRKPGKPAAALAGLVLLGLLILVVSSNRSDKPAAGAVPGGIQVHQPGPKQPAKVLPRYSPDWTHRELIAYLEAKGVKLEAAPASVHKSMFFYPPDLEGAANFIEAYGDHPGATRLLADAGIVLVTLYPTEQEAREQAALGLTSFSWHRFVFRGKAEHLKRYRLALAD